MKAGFSHDFPPGTVLTDTEVPGYRRERHTALVGPTTRFDRTAELLLAWGVQRQSGIRVLDERGDNAPDVHEGQAALLKVPTAAVAGFEARIGAPVRVVRLLRGPDPTGFVYGTLADHPERGEEAFLLHVRGDDVELELRVLSRPAFPYSLAGPLARRMQRRFTERYLEVLRE